MAKKFDTKVLIIGGGPGGIAAAIWCADLGLPCLLVDAEPVLGGQLNWIHGRIENYPGASFANGAEMLAALAGEVQRRLIPGRLNARAVAIDPKARTAKLAAGEVLGWQYAILATGVRRNELGVPGEKEFRGRGILDSGVGQRALVEGKRVAVIGGGDAAFENAFILSQTASSIKLIHRSGRFSARPEFVEQVRDRRNIEVIEQASVREFKGDEHLDSIDIFTAGGEVRRLDVDSALIRIGVAPNSELVRGVAELGPKGYVLVDQYGRTSADGIFAIGDVAFPFAPTLSTAAGSAAAAVKFISDPSAGMDANSSKK